MRTGKWSRLIAPLLVAACGLLVSAGTPLAHARHPDAAAVEAQALALADQGQRAEADKLFRRALQLDLAWLGGDHPGLAVDYSDFAANLLAEGKAREAEPLAAKAVAIVRSRRAAALELGHAPDAALARARAHVDHANPLGFVFARYLDTAWTLAAGHGGDEQLRSKAFMVAQDLAGSATAHAMAMAAARSAVKGGPLGAILQEQQRLTSDVLVLDRRLMATDAGTTEGSDSALRRRLHLDVLRLAEINRQLDRAFPDYRALISPLPLSIPHARASLTADEGLLLLLASGGDIHAFAVSRHRSAWHRIDNGAAALKPQFARLQCQLDPLTCDDHATQVPDQGVAPVPARFDLAAAHDLYARLIAPVEEPLSRARKVYVVTSGFLGDLPPALLVTSHPTAEADDSDPAVLAGAPWLGDRYAFIHLPSVAGLRLKFARAPVSRLDLLDAYGDPLLGSADAPITRGVGLLRSGQPGTPGLADPAVLRTLPSLPGTRRELTAMAAVTGAQASLHLQERATERQVKRDPELAKAGLVVFATHGLLAGEVGEGAEAGLILTPPESASAEDDGILTASEASQLGLSADWVILSACNTAAAASATGHDSMDSLGRGFLYAGAHALLASHWRISDEATAALTVEALTTHKRHPELTGAQALQSAMRAVRTGRRGDGSALPEWQPSWAHPAAWAPFSYISDHDD